MINVSNAGGSQNFSAGQFGFTPSFIQPPVILPNNPGLQFNPPPTFTQGISGNPDSQKPGEVDCIVRYAYAADLRNTIVAQFPAPNTAVVPIPNTVSTQNGIAASADTQKSDSTGSTQHQSVVYCNFAAEEKSEIQIRTDEAFAALGYVGRGTRSGGLSPPQPERLWNTWANVGGGGLRVDDTSGSGNDARGNQANITAGFERKITPDTLVGMLVGYEHLNYSVAAQGASSKSDGDSIGGYFAHMFGNVRFDAAVGWTYLNYSSAAGGNSGSFVGNRWRVSTGLTGTYMRNGFVLQPSATAFMSWERDAAWADNGGNMMDANRTSAGRTSLGTLVARPFVTSGGWIIAPYAGLYADWVFSSTSNSTLLAGPPIALVGDGWSGRGTAGLSVWPMQNVMLSLGGDYGGLGANYKIWTGNLRAAILF